MSSQDTLATSHHACRQGQRKTPRPEGLGEPPDGRWDRIPLGWTKTGWPQRLTSALALNECLHPIPELLAPGAHHLVPILNRHRRFFELVVRNDGGNQARGEGARCFLT